MNLEPPSEKPMLDPMIQILETLRMVTVGMRHKPTKEISKAATILSMTFRIKHRSSMERLQHESLKLQWEANEQKIMKSMIYDDLRTFT